MVLNLGLPYCERPLWLLGTHFWSRFPGRSGVGPKLENIIFLKKFVKSNQFIYQWQHRPSNAQLLLGSCPYAFSLWCFAWADHCAHPHVVWRDHSIECCGSPSFRSCGPIATWIPCCTAPQPRPNPGVATRCGDSSSGVLCQRHPWAWQHHPGALWSWLPSWFLSSNLKKSTILINQSLS